jgi:hypothetical protein
MSDAEFRRSVVRNHADVLDTPARNRLMKMADEVDVCDELSELANQHLCNNTRVAEAFDAQCQHGQYMHETCLECMK